jgi:hypothetical protein
MSVFLSPNLPANVVEIGNEITQAKINEINAGTLALQTWVTAGFAPKASPTFTGVVTIPAGASISGYLTTSSASSTYQTISGMSSYATTSYVTSQGYLTDAPSDGSEYVRKNAAWAISTGGGGGGISDAPSDGNLYARQNAAWAVVTIPTLSVTNIDLTGNFNGYSMGSGNYTFKFDSTANTLRMQDGSGSGITISPTGITFPNSSVLSSSPAKSVYLITGSFTLALSDANNIIYADSSAGGGMSYTISIPEDSTTDFPIGTVITFVANAGSGATADFASAGAGSPTIYGTTSYGGGSVHQAFLTKVAANTWIIK